MQEVYSVNSHKFGRLKDKKKQTLWGGLKKTYAKNAAKAPYATPSWACCFFFGRGAFYKENR